MDNYSSPVSREHVIASLESCMKTFQKCIFIWWLNIIEFLWRDKLSYENKFVLLAFELLKDQQKS